MKKIWLVVLAVALLSIRGYCESATQAPKEFGGVVVGVASMSAVVEAVDSKTREVTLKDKDGNIAIVVAGPEVRNFAQIRKGDKVNIDSTETVKIAVSPQAMNPQSQESVEVSRAPLGKKPAGVITATAQVVATVVDIDYLKRTVVLKGPQRSLTVQVDESAPNFYFVKPGDTVYLEYTKRLAIAVTK